jgi:hemerythrin-like metal-binding protein
MEWSQDFESGLLEIDDQHRLVFALIQRIRDGESRSAIRDVLLEIAQLTRNCFDYEERIMVEFAYPDAVRHAGEHTALLRELRGYQGNIVFSPRQLNTVLYNWLQSHTVMEDRRLVGHLMAVRARATKPRLAFE